LIFAGSGSIKFIKLLYKSEFDFDNVFFVF